MSLLAHQEMNDRSTPAKRSMSALFVSRNFCSFLLLPAEQHGHPLRGFGNKRKSTRKINQPYSRAAAAAAGNDLRDLLVHSPFALKAALTQSGSKVLQLRRFNSKELPLEKSSATS